MQDVFRSNVYLIESRSLLYDALFSWRLLSRCIMCVHFYINMTEKHGLILFVLF